MRRTCERQPQSQSASRFLKIIDIYKIALRLNSVPIPSVEPGEEDDLPGGAEQHHVEGHHGRHNEKVVRFSIVPRLKLAANTLKRENAQDSNPNLRLTM